VPAEPVAPPERPASVEQVLVPEPVEPVRAAPDAAAAPVPAPVQAAGGWSLERIAALFGIPFVILTLLANALPGATPLRGSSPHKFLEFFANNQTKITAAFLLITIAVFFFFPYLGILWRTFRTAEGDGAWLSTVLVTAATATAAISVADNAFWGAAAFRAHQGLSPALARTLFDLGSIFYMPWLTLSVFLAAAAALIFRTGVFPRWLGWVAAISCPLVLLTGFRGHGGVVSYFVLLGHAGLIAWAIWTVVTSVILTRRFAAAAPSRG
jgi:hypothetical protein